jgi:hypothetical protein
MLRMLNTRGIPTTDLTILYTTSDIISVPLLSNLLLLVTTGEDTGLVPSVCAPYLVGQEYDPRPLGTLGAIITH